MDTHQRKIPGPDHPITIEATGERLVVRANGTVIADSTAALTLSEAGYAPVQYFPIADVDESLLRQSPRSTYCPYKGDATYFSIVGLGRDIEDAIWTYVNTYPDVEGIAGYLAFYPDLVEIVTFDEHQSAPQL
jgi:uncharacterized protein (DUF427 family)